APRPPSPDGRRPRALRRLLRRALRVRGARARGRPPPHPGRHGRLPADAQRRSGARPAADEPLRLQLVRSRRGPRPPRGVAAGGSRGGRVAGRLHGPRPGVRPRRLPGRAVRPSRL
ncbi:MAG: hypothetical protein AVDCRST_MAG53-41, partial [uncultured Solirubrobacteraceae bacterium]